jgi:hypothetical protein
LEGVFFQRTTFFQRDFDVQEAAHFTEGSIPLDAGTAVGYRFVLNPADGGHSNRTWLAAKCKAI